MWLPTAIYERVPQVYLLIGLLLITDGLYLGFEYPIAFWYIGVGLFSCFWSLGIFLTRVAARKKRQLDQTVSS